MRGLPHSRALLTLIPPTPFSRKGLRADRCLKREMARRGVPKIYPCEIPPASFFHKGRRGSLGIQMPETGDGTQGLPKKPIPVLSPTPFSHKFRGGQNI